MKLAAFLCALSLVSTIGNAMDVSTYEPLRRAMKAPSAEALEQSLESYERAGDHHGVALSRLLLGMVTGDIESLNQSQPMLQAEGDFFATAMAVWLLAKVDREAERYDVAIRRNEHALAWLCEMETAPFRIEQVLPIAVILEKWKGIENEPPASVKDGFLSTAEYFIRVSHGQVLTDAGRFREAETELFQASAISMRIDRRTDGKTDETIASAIGDLRVAQGRLEEAYASYLEALPKAGSKSAFGASDLEIIGKLFAIDVMRGAIAHAIEWSEAAEERARVTGKTTELVTILVERAELLAGAGRFDEADPVFQKALAAAEQQPNRELMARVFFRRAMISMARGAWGNTATDFERASAIYGDLGRPAEQGIAIAMQALPLVQLGMRKNAGELLDRARKLLETRWSAGVDAFLGFLTALVNMEPGRVPAGPVLDAIAKIEALPESERSFFGDPRFLTLFRAMAGDAASLAVLRDGKPFPDAPPATAEVGQAIALLNQGQFAAARTQFLKALEVDLSADVRAQIAAGIAVTHWWRATSTNRCASSHKPPTPSRSRSRIFLIWNR